MSRLSRRATLSLAALCAAAAAGIAAAAERGSRDEAQALADAAYAHIVKVGPAKAYEDFTRDHAAWATKDLYVIVYDRRNVNLAHGAIPKLVGHDMSAVKDAFGKPVVASLNDLAAHGGGWYEYDWPDPVTRTLMHKSTYARELPDHGGFVGVGIYR